MHPSCLLLAFVLMSDPPQEPAGDCGVVEPGWTQTDPRYGILTPLPESGGVPPIVKMLSGPSQNDLDTRARQRDYRKQIRVIARKHFGDIRKESIRNEGMRLIEEFTDPAAFVPLIEELASEKDDVRARVLDHISARGDLGQGTLARLFIHGQEPWMREQAARRLATPVSPSVLAAVDDGLRSPKHAVANNAALLAGRLNILEAIPLMIFAQVAADPVENEGDLAWIAIETQVLFVVDVEAVVNNGVVAFEPVLGTVSEGTVLRIVDAVAVSYRIDVHNTLVRLTTNDWGKPTDHFSYDPNVWVKWFNEEYVPWKQKQGG